jgi:hypothetical protein
MDFSLQKIKVGYFLCFKKGNQADNVLAVSEQDAASSKTNIAVDKMFLIRDWVV